jgi:hypothetical protein
VKICTVTDCDNTHYAEGLCRLHYDRLRRRGTTADPLPKIVVKATCSEDGCENLEHSKGLCQNHYRQAARRARGLKKPGPAPDATKPKSRYNVESNKRAISERPEGSVPLPRRLMVLGGICSNGHELNEVNGFVDSNGYVKCKVCRMNWQLVRQGREPLDRLEIGVWNKDKTHCPQGHEYTTENTGYNKDGSRTCRACNRDNMRLYTYGVTPEIFTEMRAAQDNKCWICKKDFGYTTPSIDHCHVSLVVRGLLCDNCNHGLGNFHDNPELIYAAAAYLWHFGYEVIED